MAAAKIKPATIEEYIASEHRRPEVQEKMREMLACIREAAPGATEGLKWNMPAFSYKRILVTFAIFEHHIGFYPTPPVVEAFEKSLTKYVHAASSIQFPLDKPLPLALISKMVKLRVKHSEEEDKKWKG